MKLRNPGREIFVLQPGCVEIQFVQMLDATALQRLRPCLQIFFSIRQRVGNLRRLFHRALQQCCGSTQIGRRLRQLGIELR